MQTKEKIVRSAKKLFNRNGYKGTSLNQIVEESGIQKGGLYYYFSDKEELALEVIKKAENDFIQFLSTSAKGKTAYEKITNQMSAILNYHKRNQCRAGCIFGNSALEMANESEKVRNAIKDVFKKWEGLVQNLLEDAVKKGSLAKKFENKTAELAKTVVAAIEGGIMLAKTARDYNQLKTVINSVIFLFFNKEENYGKDNLRESDS